MIETFTLLTKVVPKTAKHCRQFDVSQHLIMSRQGRHTNARARNHDLLDVVSHFIGFRLDQETHRVRSNNPP